MENAKPSQVISDIFVPLRRCNDLQHAQSCNMTENDLFMFEQFQQVLLKQAVIKRLYAYFLYPPSCLCDKKKCLCNQQRSSIFTSLDVLSYTNALEVLETSQLESEKSEQLASFKAMKGVSEETAKVYMDQIYQKVSVSYKKQGRFLSGITNEQKLVEAIKAENKECQKWEEKYKELVKDKKTSYCLALGIGRHFLFQIKASRHQNLKTSKGRRGFLSFNQVVLDATGKNGDEGIGRVREFFEDVIPSEREIKKAFFYYRSILHFVLGLHSHIPLREQDPFLIFLASQTIQNYLLEASQNTFTPKKTKNLFNTNNLALVPFLRGKFSLSLSTEQHQLILKNDGLPFLSCEYLKRSENQILH